MSETADTKSAPTEPKPPVSFSLLVNRLKAMDLLAATDEVRYSICGVHVEVTGKNVKLIATDGRKMGVLNLGDVLLRDEEEAAMVPDLETSFTISSELLGKVCRAFKGKNTIVTIDRDEKNGLRIATLDGVALLGVAMDTTYPDWKKIIPSTPPVDAANLNFNIDMLHGFHAVSRILCETPFISLRAHQKSEENSTEHPYTLRFQGVEFIGFLMPTRCEDERTDAGLPAWLPKAA